MQNMQEEQYGIDPQNREQQMAYDLIAHTNISFFLTGRAGTGKTTFLHNVQKLVKKEFLVVAPTGIAAILAGGETIHSFFGLPIGVCDLGTYGGMNQTFIKVLLHVDTVIIDEVSMVRCDMLDAVDLTMRKILRNNQPFGGKQMVFVGDMFQLPPVVTAGDKEFLSMIYPEGSYYFYKSRVIKRMRLPKIELRKVYRQDDDRFLQILEDIRLNRMNAEDQRLLNSRICTPGKDDGMVITLSSRKDSANMINSQRLSEIDGKEFVYKGKLEGKMEEKNCPTDLLLHLKVGAQVMFVRNDIRNDAQRRWVNGTLGIIDKLTNEEIYVKLESGEVHSVFPCTWDSYTYEYDDESRTLKKEIAGSFTQFPLRLAWAITIHKSQGMTFDKMSIDLSRGMFADGQLYVALSRVRSLNGLYLSSRIFSFYARTNPEILSFASTYNDVRHIDSAIESGKAVYDVLQQGDYDGAAYQYLVLLERKARGGDIREAMYLSKQMLDTVICDEHLYGTIHQIPEMLRCSEHWAPRFLVALLSLYAEQYEQSLEYIEEVLSCHDCSEALYVKSRTLTKLGRYAEAERVNMILSERMNENAPDFKVQYACAFLNELYLNKTGLKDLRSVVMARPKYNHGILELRRLMKKHGLYLSARTMNHHNLVDAFNSDMKDGEFLSLLQEGRTNNALAVLHLRRSIKAMEL